MSLTLIERIFYPGANIELVFNIDSLLPRSFPSIIFDVNHTSKTITIAQPSNIRLHKDIKFDQLHATTLAKKENGEKARFGISCAIKEIQPGYKLISGETTPAVILAYSGNIIQTNIRSGYRLTLSSFYDAACKIVYDGSEFFSGKHLKIYDISTSGAGIIIYKRVNSEKNPLLMMEPGYKGKIGFILKKPDNDSSPPLSVPTHFEVARMVLNYTEKSALCGIRFHRISADHEDMISKFIHEAQLFEIHKMHG
ncbi:PilZ domain-containing protein [Desulforegula conservatrix]|uniref:PilZ domain-containing protein n=1 Tax=Desulforegula conservatrix TaxID=153026 RepID=UPI0004118ED4|nr:PilZ domain-containing protein [Desulforegula conservatrix]